jgi:hypothetical protein
MDKWLNELVKKKLYQWSDTQAQTENEIPSRCYQSW